MSAWDEQGTPVTLPMDERLSAVDRYCQELLDDAVARVTGESPPPLDEPSRQALEPGTAPPGCHYEGQGPDHSEDIWTLEFGCEHEHVGSEQTCGNHLERMKDSHRRGYRLRCHQCGHICLSVYRVRETGEEFRFNA